MTLSTRARASSKKLPKADRRTQLLDTALAIVREEGTDALTLGRVAERAGVSKPIAYNHFETRAGLMTTLYRNILDRQLEILAAAIEQTPRRLNDVASVIAQAYMECTFAVGPEWHALAAALKGEAATELEQRKMIDSYVLFCATELSPLSELPAEAVQRRCIGIIGAAEALSDDMIRGGCSKEQAATDLTALIVGCL